MSPTSRGYWRIVGATDYEQLIASQNFFGIWPKADAPLELLAAIINSPVINAYTFVHEGKRTHRVEVLANAPVPYFTPEQAELIVSLVQDYASCRLRWLRKEGEETYLREQCLQRLWQIDAAILEAYALPDNLEQELLQRFEGVKRTPLPFDFPGYGEGYASAKAALQTEKGFQAAVRRYRELCSQKYSAHTTLAETEEMQRLAQIIDAHKSASNPLYGLIGIAEGGPTDGRKTTTPISIGLKRHKVFIDTGGWVSVEWKGDDYHKIGSPYYDDLLRSGAQLLTSDYVLDETLTRLRQNARLEIAEKCWQTIRDAEKIGLLIVLSVDTSVREEAFEIFRKYRDQDFSFTDCTSFVLARRQQVDVVFAFDHHFRQFGLIVQPVP